MAAPVANQGSAGLDALQKAVQFDGQSLVLQVGNSKIEITANGINIATTGAIQIMAATNYSLMAGMNMTTAVGANMTTNAGANMTSTAGVNVAVTGGRNLNYQAGGAMQLKSGSTLSLVAPTISQTDARSSPSPARPLITPAVWRKSVP